MTMQQLAAQANPEIQVNENFDTLSHHAVYGKRQPVTTGLVWGYYGGRWGGVAITDSTVTLTDNSANYLVVERLTGALTTSTATTNWNNPAIYVRVYKITTASGAVSAVEDHRAGPYGVHGGTPPAAATTVAGLPSAATAGAGYRLFVTDATATTYLSTVAGGGSNKVPVISNGTNWVIG